MRDELCASGFPSTGKSSVCWDPLHTRRAKRVLILYILLQPPVCASRGSPQKPALLSKSRFPTMRPGILLYLLFVVRCLLSIVYRACRPPGRSSGIPKTLFHRAAGLAINRDLIHSKSDLFWSGVYCGSKPPPVPVRIPRSLTNNIGSSQG